MWAVHRRGACVDEPRGVSCSADGLEESEKALCVLSHVRLWALHREPDTPLSRKVDDVCEQLSLKEYAQRVLVTHIQLLHKEAPALEVSRPVVLEVHIVEIVEGVDPNHVPSIQTQELGAHVVPNTPSGSFGQRVRGIACLRVCF